MKWLKKILNKMALDLSREEPAVEERVVGETREQQLDRAFEKLQKQVEEGRLKQAREELTQRITRKPRTETNQEIIQRVVMSKRRPASQRPTVPINYGTAKVGSKNPFSYEIKDLEEVSGELDENQAKVKAGIERDLLMHMMAKKAAEAKAYEEAQAAKDKAELEVIRIEQARRKAEEARRAENPDWGGFS